MKNYCITSNFKQHKKSVSILIGLSVLISVTLVPFITIRFMAGNWVHAIFNLVLFVIFVFNGFYIAKTGKITIPKLIFAISIMSGIILGFYLKSVDEIPWSYPGLVALFFVVRPKLASLFCSICIIWLALLLYPVMEFIEFSTYLFTLSLTCWAVYVFANISDRQHQDLTNLSLRDPLTNLFNRRAFDRRLDECVNSSRIDELTSLILFDIDHFKRLNDEFGHTVGDRVLCKLGELVSSRMRQSDCFYRIGGEEFAVILANTNSEQATIVTNDVRCMIEIAEFIPNKQITVSLGVAEYRKDESKDAWFKRCDDALYDAKNAGRNNFKLAKMIKP